MTAYAGGTDDITNKEERDRYATGCVDGSGYIAARWRDDCTC